MTSRDSGACADDADVYIPHAHTFQSPCRCKYQWTSARTQADTSILGLHCYSVVILIHNCSGFACWVQRGVTHRWVIIALAEVNALLVVGCTRISAFQRIFVVFSACSRRPLATCCSVLKTCFQPNRLFSTVTENTFHSQNGKLPFYRSIKNNELQYRILGGSLRIFVFLLFFSSTCAPSSWWLIILPLRILTFTISNSRLI